MSMTPEEHYREAERLVKLGAEMWTEPEGDYADTETPSTEELAIRAAVQEDAYRLAAVVVAEAQVHATLALYRPAGHKPYRNPEDPSVYEGDL